MFQKILRFLIGHTHDWVTIREKSYKLTEELTLTTYGEECSICKERCYHGGLNIDSEITRKDWK